MPPPLTIATQAVRIALDVKKALVDGERLEISQAELEEVLFATLHARGYGDLVPRYRLVSRFYQQKRPLIVLICGSACTGARCGRGGGGGARALGWD